MVLKTLLELKEISFMNKSLVTETADILCKKAEMDIKYDDEDPITKQDMDKILKSLKTICNFPPIKVMRDSFSKEYNYEIVGEITTGRGI
jgi:hypothetical protein